MNELIKNMKNMQDTYKERLKEAEKEKNYLSAFYVRAKIDAYEDAIILSKAYVSDLESVLKEGGNNE